MDFHRLIRCRFFDSISRVLYIYEVIDERKRRNIPRNSSGKSYATILFSIFRLSSSIIILTFSCSTDLSLNFSHRLPCILSSILYFLCLIDEKRWTGTFVIVVGTAGSRIWTVLLGLALSFCAIRGSAAAGCTSVCSPLETSPERAGARARDRDGDRRRDEDGIETDGQSRGVDALASRREARNEA